MNIAMMTNSFAPFVGGVPISVERLARGLREAGHRVTVFAPEYPAARENAAAENEEELVRCRAFGSAGSFRAPNIFDLRPFREFGRRDFELIHVHHPMLMGNVAWALSRLHRLPLIFTWHTFYGQYMHYLGLMRGLENRAGQGRSGLTRGLAAGIHSLICAKIVPWYICAFARRCDQVLVPSVGAGKILEGKTGAAPVRVLPTGVPEGFFTGKAEERREIRRRWTPGGEKLFCTVSRLGREKNIGFLLRAVAAYKNLRGGGFRLLIIGDGPQRERLEREAEALGLAGQAVFLGGISNDRLPAYYNAADLFVFASKTETQGIVLLEAMAGGTPVVAVEAGGVRDAVTDGVNGHLVAEDPRVFAEALDRLSADAGLYRKFAREARAAARRYSSSSIAARAENIYLEALAARRKENAHDLQAVHLVSETSGSDLPH